MSILGNAGLLRWGRVWALCAVLLGGASGCGYNEVIERDEGVKAAWAEVENMYQRRADLVPNLVRVVKGSADFEKSTLEAVVQARSKVGSLQVDSSVVDDPQKLKQFEQAQGELSGALSRLLVVSENYPTLRSTEQFRDLQTQLEGTENRIAVARRDYIEAVRVYNTSLRTFPSVLWANFWFTDNEPFPTFTIAEENMETPKVDFGSGG